MRRIGKLNFFRRRQQETNPPYFPKFGLIPAMMQVPLACAAMHWRLLNLRALREAALRKGFRRNASDLITATNFIEFRLRGAAFLIIESTSCVRGALRLLT